MEGLTRLVTESLARYGCDRPLDYRRLHWSRWFRCDSNRSLLFVPSKPGIFAVAEEIMDWGGGGGAHVVPAASDVPPARSAPEPLWERVSNPVVPSAVRLDLAGSTPVPTPRRMLAVTHFFENDDMAFVLDRMLSRQNPMRARFASGRYFIRFVVIEDEAQRRSICTALNQWMVSAAEKATGIGSHFASSLELTSATEYIPPAGDAQMPAAGRTVLSANADTVKNPKENGARSTPVTAPPLVSGAATNIHCPSPFPSGF